MPIRRTGFGHLPIDGEQGHGDWQGYLAPEYLPQIWHPLNGLIVNANNRLEPKKEDFSWVPVRMVLARNLSVKANPKLFQK